MADINKLAPIILSFEGGYVNDPTDKGGATNFGVTIATWKQVGYDKDGDGDIDNTDIKLLTKDDFTRVLRIYWNRWKADDIKDQKIANILVDWIWGSGSNGIKIPQRLLGLTQDGVVGSKTIAAINSQEPVQFLAKLYQTRLEFLDNIVKNNPSQAKYIKGWKRRLDAFT